jgi:YVTN family beta-propeller protein
MSPGVYVYVPNEYDNTVSVIDTSNNSVVATVSVSGNFADGVGISPDGRLAYVASESGVVNVIDTGTNAVTATISVGAGADFVTFLPDGSKAYVTHYGGNSVTVIDTGSNTVITNITVGAGSYAVAITLDGTKAYVTNEFSSTVSVIDTSSNSVIHTINIGAGPTGIAISPDGSLVYASNWGSNTVSVIDAATDTVIHTFNVGVEPVGIVFSPDGEHAYVANQGGTVSVIDTSTNSVADTINAGEAVGIAITPDGQHLYVSAYKGGDTVTVIDTSNDTVTGTIGVGSVPEFLAVGSVPAASPPAPKLSLLVDSGRSSSDGVTNIGTVVVGGLEKGASWQYSTDNGLNWISGSGDSFTLAGDGPKSVLLHQTNGAHVTSNDASLTFTLDTRAPAVTESLKLDTGSSTDHVTNDATLTGSGDPNAIVTFNVDKGPITASATADTSGFWSFTPTGLADGPHTVLASETDAAGNTGTASLTFTLDTRAPPHMPQPGGFTGVTEHTGAEVAATPMAGLGWGNHNVDLYHGLASNDFHLI